MPRPRTNDPAGIPDIPNFVTDPGRELELCEDLRRRLQYVRAHYLFGRRIIGLQDFNLSLARLRKVVEGKALDESNGRPCILLELRISAKAREFAEERMDRDTSVVTEDDRQRSRQWAASTLKPIRGRPAAHFLYHTVAGLMALVQEYAGQPVLAGKTRNDLDDPHLKPGVSQILLMLRDIDPSVTESRLVTIVFRVRRKYAGQPMRFSSFFPGYSSIPLSIVHHTADGGRVEGGELVSPI